MLSTIKTLRLGLRLVQITCNCQHTIHTNRKRWSLKRIAVKAIICNPACRLAVKVQLRQRRQLAEALRQRRQLVPMPGVGSVRGAQDPCAKLRTHAPHPCEGLRALCSLISMHRLQNATQRHVPAHTFAQALRRDSASFVSAVSWPKLSGSCRSSWKLQSRTCVSGEGS